MNKEEQFQLLEEGLEIEAYLLKGPKKDLHAIDLLILLFQEKVVVPLFLHVHLDHLGLHEHHQLLIDLKIIMTTHDHVT